MERMELRAEQREAYRFIRVEHCTGLDDVWRAYENKEFEGSELKGRAWQAIKQGVLEARDKDVEEEEAVQAKAKALSNQKRASPPWRIVELGGLLDCVRKDGSGAFSLVLQRGEPSRLLHQRLAKDINWMFFVYARLQEPPAGIQVYPDRGPNTRAQEPGQGASQPTRPGEL